MVKIKYFPPEMEEIELRFEDSFLIDSAFDPNSHTELFPDEPEEPLS